MSKEYGTPRAQSDQLKDYGFTPGNPVYGFQPSFTRADLQEATFSSTLSHPRTVTAPIGRDVKGNIAIKSMRLVWVEDETLSRAAGRIIYHDTPDYVFEGWIDSGDGSRDKGAAVRLCVYNTKTALTSPMDQAYIQLVPLGPVADDDALIICEEIDDED